jgi:hypothetical protein
MTIMNIWLPDHNVTSPQVSKWAEKGKEDGWLDHGLLNSVLSVVEIIYVGWYERIVEGAGTVCLGALFLHWLEGTEENQKETCQSNQVSQSSIKPSTAWK